MTADEIVKKLAEMEPDAHDEDGDEYCFFCYALLWAGEKHEVDCLWQTAKELTNNPGA